MGNCNCTADDSTCMAWGVSCSFKHCRSNVEKDEQRSPEEQKFESERRQLEAALRLQRVKREYEDKVRIEEFIRDNHRLPTIEELQTNGGHGSKPSSTESR